MKILITGADSFLGYHVARQLNQRGQRPRVLLPLNTGASSTGVLALRELDVEPVTGALDDPGALLSACQGMDALLHTSFSLSLSGGQEVEQELHAGNVLGTRSLLDAATRAGVERVVVSSSALTIGLGHEPRAITEDASWQECGLALPYALSRRRAEEEALARPSGPGRPTITAVNPTFTAGPDDFSGAPANALLKRMAGGLRIDAPIGFSLLDVRDFASGVLAALERGRHGQRYLLSGTNTTPRGLLDAVSRVRGARSPRWLLPLRKRALQPLLALLALRSKLAGKRPAVTPAVLEIFGRYAWYDTRRAQSELGWQPRPLEETVRDTLAWLGQAGSPSRVQRTPEAPRTGAAP